MQRRIEIGVLATALVLGIAHHATAQRLDDLRVAVVPTLDRDRAALSPNAPATGCILPEGLYILREAAFGAATGVIIPLVLFKSGTIALRLGATFGLLGAVKGWHDYAFLSSRYDVCDDNGSRMQSASATPTRLTSVRDTSAAGAPDPR
jgi:hypothetical protein